jgi:hypothetical protein
MTEVHPATSPPRPSAESVDRLRTALRAQLEAYQRELEIDLRDVRLAAQSGRPEVALAAVDDQLARLAGFADDVRRVVAAALVEREAESVLAAAAGAVPAQPRPPRPLRRPWRRLASAGALLAAALVVVGQGGPTPHEALLAAELVSDQVVVAAMHASEAPDEEGVEELAALGVRMRDVVAGLDAGALADPAVRQRLAVMFADQQAALLVLRARVPAAGAVLQDLLDLARDLDVALPAAPLDVRTGALVQDLPAGPGDGGPAPAAGGDPAPAPRADASGGAGAPRPAGGSAPAPQGAASGSSGGGAPADAAPADPAAPDDDPQPAPQPAAEPSPSGPPQEEEPDGGPLEDVLGGGSGEVEAGGLDDGDLDDGDLDPGGAPTGTGG